MIDLVLIVDAFSDAPERPNPLPRHFREEVAISGDLFIAPFRKFRRDLLDACDRRGINWDPPTKVFPVHGAIARRDAPGHEWRFDPDRQLYRCVQLSRLVHPTSIGFDRAGRLRLDDDGAIARFTPAPIVGGPTKAWVADTTRNWLSDEDIPRVAELIEAFDNDALPERVLQALWHHEHAHQLYYADVRWPLIATGLESLVHTDRNYSTRQFVRRLFLIQEEIGTVLANEDVLGTLYDRRSRVAHGSRLGGLDEATKAQYIVLEELLRLILRKAILDHAFAAHFQSADNVRTRWPIN